MQNNHLNTCISARGVLSLCQQRFNNKINQQHENG